MWCKMSNFELSVRVPLIFRAPWLESSVGAKTRALAEAVDLFPTLAELAGIDITTGEDGGEGEGEGEGEGGGSADGPYARLGGASLVPVFKDPAHATAHDVALSQFPRCWQNNTFHMKNPFDGPGDERNHTSVFEAMSDCHWTYRGHIDFMGYSMRTPTWRYTEWVEWDGTNLRPRWDALVGAELYDHAHDDGTEGTMDAVEFENLAAPAVTRRNATLAKIVAELSERLHTEVEKWISPTP